MLINTKYRLSSTFGGMTFTVHELCPFLNIKFSNVFQFPSPTLGCLYQFTYRHPAHNYLLTNEIADARAFFCCHNKTQTNNDVCLKLSEYTIMVKGCC